MKKGFNLAEVLITLGILGVIIAMTLPTIIKNYRNKVLKQQFKVAYSIVYEAVKRMSVNNSDILNTYCGLNYTNTSIEARTRFGKDFSKYFDVVYDKTSDPNAYLTIYDNTRLKQPNYKKFDKLTDANGYNDGLFIIKNGMIIMNGHCWIGASNKKGQHVEFLIDINGKKGPNAMGYDLFYFWIDDKNQLVTCPQIPNNKAYCNFLTEDTTGSHNGVNCSTFALNDKFPNDERKPYWDNLP